ncbi:MAG: hypothetical protein AABX16_00375 [Nanoarchaeota archaeon]
MNNVMIFAFFLSVLFLMGNAAAYQRLCLTSGQSVPNQQDSRYTCQSDRCEICVTDNNYPTNPSYCNSVKGCQLFNTEDNNPLVTNNSSTVNNNNNNNNNNNSTANGNSQTQTNNNINTDTNAENTINSNEDFPVELSGDTIKSTPKEKNTETPKSIFSFSSRNEKTNNENSGTYSSYLLIISSGITFILFIILVSLVIIYNFKLSANNLTHAPSQKVKL